MFLLNRHRDVFLCPAGAVITLQFYDHHCFIPQGSTAPRALDWITSGKDRLHWDHYVWHGGNATKMIDPKTHTMDFKRLQSRQADLNVAQNIHMWLAHSGR